MIALALALAAAAPAAQVPFVGCPSDGQLGPVPAPHAGATPRVPAAAAWRLAYYVSAAHGVLAPRGWHCFGLYGSDGSLLIVAPEPLTADRLLDAAAPRPLRGPAIQITYSEGGTSGRFEVAKLIAELFPAHADFARSVAEEGIGDPLPQGPPPADRLQRLGPNEMRYLTPAGRDGLGTQSRLAANAEPIAGWVRLDPEGDFSTVKLDIRLPAADANLAGTIIAAARRTR